MADLGSEPKLKQFLRFMKYLTQLILAVNNLGQATIEKINQQAEFFFKIGFLLTPNAIGQAYLNQGDLDEKLSAIAEEVLGNSINYFRGLLEDPNIWISDMMGLEAHETNTPDLESHVNNIFTEAKIFEILQAITHKYLLLTPEEVQKW